MSAQVIDLSAYRSQRQQVAVPERDDLFEWLRLNSYHSRRERRGVVAQRSDAVGRLPRGRKQKSTLVDA
jgi:hypothetical protein